MKCLLRIPGPSNPILAETGSLLERVIFPFASEKYLKQTRAKFVWVS
jgi:hypothetical protein